MGTEEGSIHKCSKAYGSDYLATYSGHGMPVYAVKWNTMHPGLFLSCSADWSVKVGRACNAACRWGQTTERKFARSPDHLSSVTSSSLCCSCALPLTVCTHLPHVHTSINTCRNCCML